MPKKQPESTATSTRKLPPTKIANFAKGERVSYIGQRYEDQYIGLSLVVDQIVWDGRSPAVACRKPDGSFTTWLNSEELAPVNCVSPQPLSEPVAQSVPELPATVTRADATNLKDIATVWWDVYYPEHIQSLRTQLFGWGSVGNRYSAETVFEWLKVQKVLVRDRITELYRMAGRSPEVVEVEVVGAIEGDDIGF